MPWAAAGGALSAVGSITSGILGSNAASSAAKAQQQAAAQATALEQQQFQTTQANLQPFLAGGTNAFSQLQGLLGLNQGGGGPTSPILQMLGIGGPGGTGAGNINPSTFQGSPGYQYQVQQGQNALTNQFAAQGGGATSGNALRALQQQGKGMANQNWNAYLGQAGNAWQQLVGNVANVAGAGQNAAVQQGGFGQNFGTQAGSNAIGAGNAQAGGIVGSTNALAGGIGGGIGGLNALLTNPQLQALIQNMGGGGTQVAAGNSTNPLAINTPFNIPAGTDAGSWA